jgi:hypothetical protein
MRLPIETANLRRRANFDAHEIGQPVPGPIETLDSDEPWMGDHFTQENFEQLQDAQIDGELGPALDLTRQAMLKKWKFARFAEGDTAGFEKWLKTQPKAVQDDWESNKERYGDQFKTAKQITPLAEAKKGDFVEVTYKGEKVTGKVYHVKVDGTITVDVEKTRDNPGGHSDEDVSLVDIRVSKKARFAEGDTAGFEKWLKTQPKSVQEDWESNKEKYGDQFKTASTFRKTAGKKPTSAEKAEAKKLFDKWRADADGAEMDDLDESWQNFLDGDLSLKDIKDNPPSKTASKKAHRRNASGIDSNPYLDHKVKAAIMAFEEALDELIRKEGALCRVASSSLNEIGDRLLEERKKFMMEGNHRDDFSNTTKGFLISEVSEYLEGITEACNSMSGSRFQRLISMAFSINSKA